MTNAIMDIQDLSLFNSVETSLDHELEFRTKFMIQSKLCQHSLMKLTLQSIDIAFISITEICD